MSEIREKLTAALLVGEPTTTTLNVVTNWFEVLEAKVGR